MQIPCFWMFKAAKQTFPLCDRNYLATTVDLMFIHMRFSFLDEAKPRDYNVGVCVTYAAIQIGHNIRLKITTTFRKEHMQL